MSDAVATLESVGTNVLLAVTGSVAAIKTVDICKALKGKIANIQIRICVTHSAKHFVDLFGRKEINEMNIEILEDDHEWNSWSQRGDPVVHIELRKWADIMVIAPLSANTLAKLANGICDNLVTSVFRAWNLKEKAVIVAPAMNTLMWNNPFTEQHLKTLRSLLGDRLHVIEPISKKLMCNDVGKGAMATPQTIAETAADVLLNKWLPISSPKQINRALLLVGIVFVALCLYRPQRRQQSE